MQFGSRYGLPFTSTGALLVLSLAGAPGVALSQGIDTRCPAGSLNEQTTQDACQKAVDIFAFMTPQLGIGLVGGNATLGATSALGGIGHFSIGVRGNATRGRVPQVSDVSYSVTGAEQSDFGVQDQVVGLPAVDAAIGLFGGIPLGLSRALALDGLVSATYVPAFNNSSMAVSLPDGSLKLGYGARLGILAESFAIPAVSVTYLRRDLPSTSISATSGDDDISVSNIGVKTSAWRAVAGKSLGFFGIALGAFCACERRRRRRRWRSLRAVAEGDAREHVRGLLVQLPVHQVRRGNRAGVGRKDRHVQHLLGQAGG
jgi:hypothetical protein